MTDTPSRPAPQQEQAARFVVGYEGTVFDSAHQRHWYCAEPLSFEERKAYARAIAAALNASPPKEAT